MSDDINDYSHLTHRCEECGERTTDETVGVLGFALCPEHREEDPEYLEACKDVS